MDKFKSYLGLAVTLAVAWLFLWPDPASPYHDMVHATPLDRTGISQIIQYRTPAFNLLAHAQAYAERCPEGPETRDLTPHASCGLYLLAPDFINVYDVAQDIQAYDPGFFNALSVYDDAPSGDAKDQAWVEVQRRAVATYAKLLPGYEASFKVATYLFHALFIGLLVLAVLFRRQIGAALLFPLTLLLSLLKKAHEQV